MRPLQDLPRRFWPAHMLPEGTPRPSRVTNQKAASFKKAYTRVVSPVLREAGFRCRGTRGERLGACLWEGTWFLGGKYGGTGMMIIAAHPPGFPARNDFEVSAPYDYAACIFMRALRFYDGRGGDEFDLGASHEEGLETAALMAEAFETQGLAYLEALATALPRLQAVTPATFEAELPALHEQLGLRVTDSSFERVDNSVPQLALLLARVHREAGTPHVAGFCEMGLAATQATWPPDCTPSRLHQALFTRLPTGEGPLHPTEAEKRAADARGA